MAGDFSKWLAGVERFRPRGVLGSGQSQGVCSGSERALRTGLQGEAWGSAVEIVNPPLRIELTPEAQATLKATRELPQTMLAGIAQAMRTQTDLTISHIQKEYMSFPKDGETVFPGLRAITGRLRSSLHAAPPEVSGQEVTTSIGSNVVYAPVHEFGARIVRKSRRGVTRLRLDSRGGLLKNFVTGKGAQFAKASHKRVKEVAFESKETSFTIPARAPIQRGIEDRLNNYQEAISKAVAEAWEK